MAETFVEKLGAELVNEYRQIWPGMWPAKADAERLVLAILRAARVPSEGMLAHVSLLHDEAFRDRERWTDTDTWQAMIDHALAEHSEKNEDAA